MKCFNCGSENILIDSPYKELKRDGTYGNIQTFCCRVQKTNAIYAKKRFKQGEAPDREVIEKL